MIQVPAASLVEELAVLLQQRHAEPIDPAERRAQVVRDGVAERLELLVLSLKLGDERRARVGDLAGRPLLGGEDLAVEERLADPAMLVLELLAAHLGAHTHLEDLELARLRYVVVGAELEPLQHGLAVIEGRQHDERHVSDDGALLDALARGLPAEAGHDQVEEDAVDGLDREDLDGLLPRPREHDVVSFASEDLPELVEVRGAVVHGEDSLGAEQARGVHGRRRHRAEDRGEPGEDDVEVFVLAHEGVGARVEGAELGAVVVGAGQQDTRGLPERFVEADAPDDGGPVDAGQESVDQDGGRTVGGGHVEPILAARGLEHGIARAVEDAPELRAERGAVVDDEHGRSLDRAMRSPARRALARARRRS